MGILCWSEYCLSEAVSVAKIHKGSPWRCRLSYNFSPKVCGSCNISNAGKFGVAPKPAALFLRFYLSSARSFPR